MSANLPTPEFDLFVSYAHADDSGSHAGKVTALVAAIKADYLRVTGTPSRVCFDTDEIRSMDAWEARILIGLRQSKMMAAILSPSYFGSAYCFKEWEIYVETELAQAVPGEGISPIYVITHPAFDADPVEERLRPWVNDLRRRQYIGWLPFWPEGAAALFFRLSDAAPEDAHYARALWVSYWKMADFSEIHPGTDDAEVWWRRAYDVLSGMQRRGVVISPDDEGFLKQLARKVGH